MRNSRPRILLFIGSILLCFQAKAGNHDRIYKFWVEMKDKRGSEYTILRPWDFLSTRAILRRDRVGFAVTTDDLPVNRKYVKSVMETGVRILLESRWMNAVLVSTTDSSLSNALAKLEFVKMVSLVGTYNRKRGMAEADPDAAGKPENYAIERQERIAVGNKVKPEGYNEGYGMGWQQINMMKGQELHKAGYRGEGIYIAILDAGFYRADRMQAFDSLFLNQRFLGAIDMVDKGSSVFDDDDHGTQVLSCMASYAPGVMVGTAPNASYLLIRTEDAGSETLAEEMQWLCAAELADSAGVDMISSSLGYTEFDDRRMGHKYSDLDGHTTVITRAANMAWDRGMIVVNAAGNEGDDKWKFIGAPADADGVIAVGAVDEIGRYVSYSSVGPTADGRVKPDLVAMGKRSTVINSNGYFIHSNGTSYSAPILAGSLACLLQANYAQGANNIRKILMLSSVNFLGENNQTGHGLPDFKFALEILKNNRASDSANPFYYWPDGDTLTSGFDLKTLKKPGVSYSYKLKDDRGKSVSQGTLFKYENLVYVSRLEMDDKGEYWLEVSDGNQIWNCRFYFAKKPKEKNK